MDKYFTYSMGAGCGITAVKFMGTLDDWTNLRKKFEGLDEYGCGAWVTALLPVLDKFIDTYQGKVDFDFWDTCIKAHPQEYDGYYDGNYGSTNGLSGWVLNFFPYDTNGKPQYSTFQDLKKIMKSR